MIIREKFKTTIGGQALIEGIMMRGPEATSMAVRLPGGDVDCETWSTAKSSKWYKKAPFVRGMFNMIDALAIGYRCLMKSAEKQGIEDETPKWVIKLFGEKGGDVFNKFITTISGVIGGALAIGLFMFLPTFLAGLLGDVIATSMMRSLVEGIIRISLFVIYLALVSRMPDIKRVFGYHGAEHMCIACYEAELPLTVENVRPQSRFHPRCGTSFLLIVMVVSIVLFSFITAQTILIRVVVRILLLPAVVGIAYEIIKYAGRHNNPLTRLVSSPGLCLQKLTTYQPDDKQIEVAIAALEKVIPKSSGADAW